MKPPSLILLTEEDQHGAFAIKTIRARPMKTPALQATLPLVEVIHDSCQFHGRFRI